MLYIVVGSTFHVVPGTTTDDLLVDLTSSYIATITHLLNDTCVSIAKSTVWV